nr:unnamed protein product [Callosobruchus analis]
MKCDIRNMRTPQDKVCVVMFDEIHLQANLTYERKQDEIFGLEDHECQRVGLEVIATVCDQGTKNQSAINLLLRETEEHYLRAGTANRNFGFVINGQEIVPLYDGCRNNLLTKNLHFRLDGENKVAKWVHLR